MSDSTSLRDRSLTLIDQIVQMTLKGKIRSKEQVYQMLLQEVSPGSGEIFERCLSERLATLEHQSATQVDEFKQAKAVRSVRALKTIQGEWERWQEQNQATESLTSAVQHIVQASPGDRLGVLLQTLDPNRPQPLSLAQWQQLAKRLSAVLPEVAAEEAEEIQNFAQGIQHGLHDWQKLENHLVSWIYDQSQGQLGFEGVPGQRGPWMVWAKQISDRIPASLFQALATEQSIIEWADRQANLQVDGFLEIAIVLRCLQQGLVTWFDKLVYDSKVGAKLSISTFLGFSVIWSQLASGFNRANLLGARGDRFANGCFQITLQILRTFAQRDYFPLYGGVFASFSGQYLRDALSYLDEPLQRAEGTQEKARILTLLGSSLRAQGQVERAIRFHQQALEIAQTAGDRRCEVANLNHLSRTFMALAKYEEATSHSQRALILSRQSGDQQGEANALANLGYAEVFQARQLDRPDPDRYEAAIERLQQGLRMSERLGDRQSQALCLSSLGIAHVVLEQPQAAIAYLEGGIQAAQFSGDVYLQGINLAYLSEAHHQLENSDLAVYAGCLGMYLLEQIASSTWRQPAGLLVVLRGKLGEERFQEILRQQRPKIIAVIGVDGYDHLPTLLEQYQS